MGWSQSGRLMTLWTSRLPALCSPLMWEEQERLWGCETLQMFSRTVWFGPWYHHKCIDCVQSSVVEVCNFFAFINIWLVCGQFFPGSEQKAYRQHKCTLKRKLNLIGKGCRCATVVMVSNLMFYRATMFYLVWTICCILQHGRYLVDELTSDYLFLNNSCSDPGSTKISSKAKKDMFRWSETHRSAFFCARWKSVHALYTLKIKEYFTVTHNENF